MHRRRLRFVVPMVGSIFSLHTSDTLRVAWPFLLWLAQDAEVIYVRSVSAGDRQFLAYSFTDAALSTLLHGKTEWLLDASTTLGPRQTIEPYSYCVSTTSIGAYAQSVSSFNLYNINNRREGIYNIFNKKRDG